MQRITKGLSEAELLLVGNLLAWQSKGVGSDNHSVDQLHMKATNLLKPILGRILSSAVFFYILPQQIFNALRLGARDNITVAISATVLLPSLPQLLINSDAFYGSAILSDTGHINHRLGLNTAS